MTSDLYNIYLNTIVTEAVLPSGVIGTIALSENRQFSPADYDNDGPQFYLNTEDPATANGIVEMLRLCYDLDEGQGEEILYQATIGFYHPEGHNSFSLITSVNVTKSGADQDQSRCEDMAIPSTELHEGDLIGVCARNFNSSVRRINFVVNDYGNDLNRDLQREDSDNQVLCTAIGNVPSSLGDDILVSANQHILRIFGFINGT